MPAARARRAIVGAALAALGVAGCESAKLPLEATIGPDPALPPANETLVPTVHVAPANGWPEGRAPAAAPDTAVTAFASGLEHPRWVHVLPNGDVLVAETNAPPRPDDAQGLIPLGREAPPTRIAGVDEKGGAGGEASS